MAAGEAKSRVNFIPLDPSEDRKESGDYFPGLDWMSRPMIKPFDHFKGYYIPQVWSERLVLTNHFDERVGQDICHFVDGISGAPIYSASKYSQRAIDIMFSIALFIVPEVRKTGTVMLRAQVIFNVIRSV